MFKLLKDLGVSSDLMYGLGFASVLVSILLYSRAGSRDDPNTARQRAIFVGLWPPTFMAIGNGLKQLER